MKRVDILNNKMFPTLLKLSWPMILANMFQNIYNIIDTFWLGKLGKEAVAAPTVAWPIIFTFISISSGFSVAALALVSQYIGAGRKDEARLYSAQVFSLTFIISIVFSIFGFFSGNILMLLDIPEEMFQLTDVYLKTILFGLPFTFVGFAFNSIFTGWGDTLTPMILSSFSLVANVILDPLLIFGMGPFPELGVFGAALATVICRSIVFFAGTFILFKGKGEIKIFLKDLLPKRNCVRKILKIGLPSSFGQFVTSLAFVIITSLVAQFGTVATAAMGVGQRIISIANMFAFGVAQAAAAMVGQYLGAERKNDAYKVVWKAAFFNIVVVGIMCTFTFLFGKEITAFFVNEPEVLVEGQNFFNIVSFSIPFFVTFAIFDNALRSSGHTVVSMIINIVRLWGIRLPVIYLMGLSLGTTGIWYAMFISNMAVMIISAIVILRKKWLEKVI
ncbi:MAG: hypothetical protein PWQ77_2058 [Kosmotogales bacterium]|nr:hypothetical protein [Kosmotogales bacterium]